MFFYKQLSRRTLKKEQTSQEFTSESNSIIWGFYFWVGLCSGDQLNYRNYTMREFSFCLNGEHSEYILLFYYYSIADSTGAPFVHTKWMKIL